MSANADLVRDLWRAMEARDWTCVEELCADDLRYSLPQSAEMHGRSGYLRMNSEYPGDWHVTLTHLIDGGEWIVTEVTVSIDGRTDRGVTLFRVAGSKVAEIREYWPEPFPVPEWRAAWSQE